MARRRFYASPADIAADQINLSSHESHHLIRVLRLKPGSVVFVFDGLGKEYRCVYLEETGSRARLEVVELLPDIVESPLNLTLVQSLVKGDKFDFIVQKATELGVSRIIPLACDHSDVRLAGDQSLKRVERWQRISLEALKQCGRRRLVEITSIMALEALLDMAISTIRPGRLLLFSEKGGQNLSVAIKSVAAESGILALIGPEGGWSELELEALERADARSVSLGPRILRTETAAVVAMTLLQNHLGDLSR